MAAHPGKGTATVRVEGDDALDVDVLVRRWRDADLDAEALLRSELLRALRPTIQDRTGTAGAHLEQAVTIVLDATSPQRSTDPVRGRVVPDDPDQWRRWPAATFAASVLACLADLRDDIATMDFEPPADETPVAQRVLLRLVEVEGLEAPEAGALLCLRAEETFELLDRAHDAVGWDPSGQVLCRGWQAVRAMDRRSAAERADAQRHLANCRACGRAYADRLRRREFLLRLLPDDVQRRPLLAPVRDDLAGIDAEEAIHRA